MKSYEANEIKVLPSGASGATETVTKTKVQSHDYAFQYKACNFV